MVVSLLMDSKDLFTFIVANIGFESHHISLCVVCFVYWRFADFRIV